MKKQYNGLDAIKIEVDNGGFLTSSVSNCQAMIQLKMVDGVCVSDPSLQQVEWVGENG